jgi:universal stress protein A
VKRAVSLLVDGIDLVTGTSQVWRQRRATMSKLFRRILVPHDFSAPANRALKVAGQLAADARGRITVLHALLPYPLTGLTPAEGIPFIPPQDLVKPARERLEALVRRTLGRRVRVNCRVVVGDATQEILAAARAATSIVMATEGRTGLSHLLIGSVAEKVVRHSPRPVLTLRTAARARRSPRRPRRPRRA